MNKPSPAQRELARRLLAREVRRSTEAAEAVAATAAATAADPAAAAARMYERIVVRLSPLIGTAGVHALFARSVKLAQSEHACLLGLATTPAARFSAGDESSPAQLLRACLQKQEPHVTLEPAEALFGHFFTLLAAFIGERLTAQVVEGAWPEKSAPGPVERKT